MSDPASETEHTGPTIRDRRRIDPDTYQVREPQPAAAPGAGGPTDVTDVTDVTGVTGVTGVTDTVDAADAAGAPAPVSTEEVDQLKAAVADRTSDLQRLQAEYVNYKRRVDRDRDVARKSGIEAVLKDLMSVLDDVRSAREHGELSGGFKAVSDEVERVAARYGLESYGTKGEPFDPHIHEALLHAHAEGIDGPTCVEILQPGYRIGDRVLRPARVAVAEPDPNARPAPSATPEPGTSQAATPEPATREAGTSDAGTSEAAAPEAATEASDASSDDEH